MKKSYTILSALLLVGLAIIISSNFSVNTNSDYNYAQDLMKATITTDQDALTVQLDVLEARISDRLRTLKQQEKSGAAICPLFASEIDRLQYAKKELEGRMRHLELDSWSNWKVFKSELDEMITELERDLYTTEMALAER